MDKIASTIRILNLKFACSILFFLMMGVSSVAYAQTTRTLKGIVEEEGTGYPLIGANVWLKESSVGTITDVDGKFTLSVPAGRTVVLNISYIGYQQTEKEVSVDENNLKIMLAPQSDVLDEVVVVGFGTQRKESVIGAISNIKIDELKVPTGSISTSLAGKLSGVVSVQRSGEPGASAEFWLRGISTFGENKTPLILVDGVERSLDLLDPEEIETFSLLKDATATALYGVRGANGVVLITTRRGKEGKPSISVRAETGIMQLTKIPEMADAVDYANLYNELMGYNYYSDEVINKYRTGIDPDLYPNINWIDACFKPTTNNQRVTANISGGGNIARYFISASFYNEDGALRSDGGSYNGNPNFKRYNFRSNVDVNLTPTTELGLTIGGFLTQKKTSSDMDGVWKSCFTLPANAFPIQYSNGNWAGRQGVVNPYYTITQAGYNDEWQSTLNSQLKLEQDFSFWTKGLKASVMFAFDTRAWHTNKYTRQNEIWYAKGRDDNGNLIFDTPEINAGGPWFKNTSGGDNANYLEASITYNRTFGKNRVGGLLLYNHRIKKQTAGDAIWSLSYKNQGLAGRLTYDYDNRYFIEGNFGYNGSENFSSGNRVGFFPSAAFGWYISNEPFFEDLTPVVSKLKLKGSIGQVGNDKIGGGVRFIYLGTVTGTDKYIYGNYTGASGERVNEVPNPFVSWEVSTKQNYGMEIGLFNKLNIQTDMYRDVRDHIFVRNNNIPAYVGITTVPMVNVGKMKSWGYDLDVEYNEKIQDVYLTLRGTFTHASNKILRNGDAVNKYPYMNTVGQKIYQKWGFQDLGLFSSQDEIDRSPVQFSEAVHSTLRPGDIKYQDINGDGVINDFDKIPIGFCDIPENTYGFGGSIGWKGIDLSFFFQGIGRVSAFEEGTTLNPFTSGYANNDGFHKDVVANRWTEANPNPNARYPRINGVEEKNNNNLKKSTFWMRDASYLRLKNLEIGYSFPKKWVNKAYIQNLRIYASGVNLLTWAKDMHLYDPELGSTDGRKYPPSRIYNFGLNVSF